MVFTCNWQFSLVTLLVLLTLSGGGGMSVDARLLDGPDEHALSLDNIDKSTAFATQVSVHPAAQGRS